MFRRLLRWRRKRRAAGRRSGRYTSEQTLASAALQAQPAHRLGTFPGVFTPGVQTILGVMMHLRFGGVPFFPHGIRPHRGRLPVPFALNTQISLIPSSSQVRITEMIPCSF